MAVLTAVVLLLAASAPGPLPQQTKFWNASDGVGVFWHCTRSCRSELRTTVDGGRSWQFARAAPSRGSLTIAPGGDAWIGRFVSTDRGRRWRSLPSGRFLPLAFSDAEHGWGVDSLASEGSLRQRLARTSSGGRSWSRMRNPCDRSGEALVDLSSPTPLKAWALCSGLYGAGNDAKAIYRTDDAGAHWALVNQSDFQGSSRRRVGSARLGLQDARRRQALARRQADDTRGARGEIDLFPLGRARPGVDPRLWSARVSARSDRERRHELVSRSTLALRLSTTVLW